MSWGIERLRGDFAGSFLITFAELCIRAGDGCSIFVDFMGFEEWFVVGMEEFLLLADADADEVWVGLIDDNLA